MCCCLTHKSALAHSWCIRYPDKMGIFFMMLKSRPVGPISEGFLGCSAENKECFTWRNPLGTSDLCAWTASCGSPPMKLGRSGWVTGREERVDARCAKPALPYICLLMSFTFVTDPSTTPLVIHQVKPACTAALSRSTPMANDWSSERSLLQTCSNHVSSRCPSLL